MTIELQTGMRIKTYVLLEPIGRGAAGEVWKATDGKQDFAIKFVNLQGDAAAQAKYRQSLEVEANALRKLQHPNIPAFFDYDVSGERPYLVMQHVGGLTYDHLLVSGDLLCVSAPKRLDALQAIATAVQAAHQQGIIHRDIKPANISGIDHPYLLDFGIALEDGHAAHPDVGTAIYMPPDDGADALSDNYSFALLAYEVLFGRHPIFTPETIGKSVRETRHIAGDMLRRGQWRWPSHIPLPELPGDLYAADFERLDAIFARGFAPPSARYVFLFEMVNDLREAILTPENQPFLDRAAPPLIRPAPIPTEAEYTANEVAIDRQPTDHGLRLTSRRRNGLILASTLALLFWFLLIGLLVLLYRPR